MKKIEMWEMWIKTPPTKLISFNKGKTWEITALPFFPFATIDDIKYIFYKKYITNNIKQLILKSRESNPKPTQPDCLGQG